MSYSIQSESEKILGSLVKDSRLPIPEEARKLADRTKFPKENVVNDPFMPMPLKISECSSALWGLIGTLGNAIQKERYGIDQDAIVNTDLATLYLLSAPIATINGVGLREPEVAQRFAQFDLGNMAETYRRLATNVYRTKDGRYFHLHGSLNATPTLTMLGVPLSKPGLEYDEVVKMHQSEVEKYDSRWLDVTANEKYRQAGTICYTPEEFLQTEQGQATKDDPIYSIEVEEEQLPATGWPEVPSSDGQGPLAGIRILDLSRIIAAPSIARVCAYLGADVMRISTDTQPDWGILLVDGNTGKRDARLNLKDPKDKDTLEKLILEADVILEGFRPGTLDRLGFSRAYIHELAHRRNKGIVHIRENCYGWHGPWQHRSGWQQISDCVTGAAWLQGKFLGLDEAVVPPIPNSDYQVGLSGAAAILNALMLRARNGGSYSVDVSLNQFNLFYLAQGQEPEDVQERLKKEYKGLLPLRHYHDMAAGIGILGKALATLQPKFFLNKDNFIVIDASKWESGDKAGVVKPALEMSGSKLAYLRGTCKPGTYEPKW
uniref:ARAD1A05390p n=1 Tax=Blastobotrys adeninivorans TaxID=409370 RepID=A0A060T306_BLAAD